MTLCFIVTVECQVIHVCYDQHHLEGGGVQLINKHPLGHGILRQSAVDQLPLVLDPTDFLSD
jgi:hypothetical protein